MVSNGPVPLEFGNIDHIIIARRGCMFRVCAEIAEMQRVLSNLRCEEDSDTGKMRIPSFNVQRYQIARLLLHSMEGELSIVSKRLNAVEAERAFMRRKTTACLQI